MVSAQTLYSPRSDRRENCRTANNPYHYLTERRSYSGSLPQHNSRVFTMADQGDGDSASHRKRISVACGRCRRRKIRCSGDPGGGLPCTNCKNAGSEPCQFLRVQSQEAAFKYDNYPEYSYNVQEAKARNSIVSTTMAYTHELPHAGSAEMLSGGQYRSGSVYSYGKPHASYYSPMPAGYSMTYVDDYADYPTVAHHSSQHVMGQDMVSYSTWPGRDYGYGGTTSLVHRPAPSVASESANFSFHNMAAQLPASSVSVPDRLLPAPSSRGLSYAGPPSHSYRALPPAGGADPSPVNAAAVLADMASGTYGSGFDGLPYNGSATAISLQATHAGSGSSDHHPSSQSTNSEPYSPDSSESIFAEHEQALRSQGSAVDLNSYTYGSTTEAGSSSLRRGSAAHQPDCPTSVSNSSSQSTNRVGAGKGRSSTSSSMAHGHHSQQHQQHQQHQQQIYMPATGGSIHDSTSSLHQQAHHHLPLVNNTASGDGGACGSTTSAQAYLAESNNSSSNPSGTGSAHRHAEVRRGATVGSRR